MLTITRSRSKTSEINHEHVLLMQPTDQEVKNVKVKHHVPPSFLQAALQKNALPSVKLRGDALMMIVQAPIATEKKKGIAYDSIAIGIYLAPTYTVTICASTHPILSMTTTFSHEYVLALLQLIAMHTIDALYEIDMRVTETENKLKTAIHNKQMFNLMAYNRSLTMMARTAKANQMMVHKLVYELHTWLDGEEDQQLLDIEVALNQAANMAQVYNINLGGLMDAYSAMIENNLSISVQRLTVYVLMAAVPLGAAGIYGMNTPLPFQDAPYALTIIMFICVVMIVLSGFILRKKQII